MFGDRLLTTLGDFEPLFQPEELIGMTFNYQLEDKEVTAKIVSKIIEQNEGLRDQVKFLLKVGDDEYDRILSYNEVCDLMEEQRAIVEEEETAPDEVKYDLEQILKHEGPLKPTDDGYTSMPPSQMGIPFTRRCSWSTWDW